RGKDFHMVLSTLRKWVGGSRGTQRVSAGPRHRRRFQPRVESLEDRAVPSAMLMVDDDHAQCPTAQYTSINAAVAAAQPGDTIHVCAGTYHESVTVNKTLTFVADHHGGDVIVDPGATGSGFNVQANGVRIQGFTIQAA